MYTILNEECKAGRLPTRTCGIQCLGRGLLSASDTALASWALHALSYRSTSDWRYRDRSDWIELARAHPAARAVRTGIVARRVLLWVTSKKVERAKRVDVALCVHSIQILVHPRKYLIEVLTSAAPPMRPSEPASPSGPATRASTSARSSYGPGTPGRTAVW